MPPKTLVVSTIEKYLACEGEWPEEQVERNDRLSKFSYPVMLELAVPELDYTTRWCWQHFGPMDGECTQKYSEYRVCNDEIPHHHAGKWTSHWFAKTDYDFGFNELYFREEADRELFLAHVSEMNWGENYPK